MVIDQAVINIAIGLIFSVSGWVLKSIWDALKALQIMDTQMADKVNAIELLVAGQYMRKDDFDRFCTAIFVKLDKILDKVDNKVDRFDCESSRKLSKADCRDDG